MLIQLMTTQPAQQINSAIPFTSNGIFDFVDCESRTLDCCEVFEALGHRTRLKVFDFIYRAGEKGARPKDIIDQYGVDSGTLDFHLKKLLSVGLIVLRQSGLRGTYCPTQNLPLGLILLFSGNAADSD